MDADCFLGKVVEDKVTGYKGVCPFYQKDMAGRIYIFIQQKLKGNGEIPAPIPFIIERIEIVEEE